MNENSQTWLSLTGICTTLNISHLHAKWLAKRGFLSYIPGNRGREWKDARFLDPTPDYAAQLKLGEALYGRLFPVPIDLELAGLLTIREVAQIMGWTMRYARKFAWKGKITPTVKIGITEFYSIKTVRELFWRRRGRGLSKQKSPFLVQELIDYFFKVTAEAEQEVPTDEQLLQDALIQRKLGRIGKMKTPHRELAMQDFMTKVALAKSLVSSR